MLAVAVVWAGIVGWGNRGAGGIGGQPLPVWEEADLDRTWGRDTNLRWAYAKHDGFPAEAAAGVWVDVEPARAGHVQVRLSFRFSETEDWQTLTQSHHVSQAWVYFDLSDHPAWRGSVREIMIQILHDADFRVERIAVESHGLIPGLRRGLRELTGTEIYGGQSTVNILYGPKLLGWSLTAWLALTLVGLGIIEWWMARTQRRGIRRRWLIAGFLAAWLGSDLLFTLNLATNARADLARYPAIAHREAVAAFGGDEFYDMVTSVQTFVPEEKSMAFLSNDPFNVIRAKYLFYPRRLVGPLRLRNFRRPDFIALYRVSTAKLEDDNKVLTLNNGKRYRVAVVESGPGRAIVRVRRQLPRVRLKASPQ